MALTERKLLILQAIIDDYILTGIPVGSRTLSKHSNINFSSATIRNDMADLEEEGYLEQPHTSAGRLPSDKAYRLYVDTLMRVSHLNQDEINYIQQYFSNKINEVEKTITNTAHILSEITNLTSVVLAPQVSKVEINRLQLVKLSGNQALLVIVFSSGIVKDVLIPVSEEMSDAYLDMLSNILSENVRGLTLPEALSAIRTIMYQDVSIHRDFVEQMLTAVKNNIASQAKNQVILGGTQNIFNHPEYRDFDRAKNFLQLLESKEPLYDMLTKATDMEFTIHIGKENRIDELKDMSVVTATYKIGEKNIGSFGVIGPTRMNYGKIISILDYVGRSMNELLNCYNSIDKKEGK